MTDSSDKNVDIHPGGALRRLTKKARRLPGANRLHTLTQRTGAKLSSLSKQHLLPHLESTLEWATSPEQIERAQETLTKIAHIALDQGFRIDPNAHTLFTLVHALETRHGKAQIMSCLAHHNPMLDESLLLLAQSKYALSLTEHDFQTQQNQYIVHRERVRIHFLHMLCAFAKLDDPSLPDIDSTDPHKLSSHLASHDLPSSYHQLATLALGTSPLQQTSAHLTKHTPHSRLRRTLSRLSSSASNTLRTTSIQRFDVRDHDPSFTFLVHSYLFFLQSYMTKNMLENLPSLITALRHYTNPSTPSEDLDDTQNVPIIDISKKTSP